MMNKYRGFTLIELMVVIAIAGILAAVILPLLMDKSSSGSTTVAKIEESKKAQEAADSITFTENAEIDNIKKRLELTSDPGLTGFIILLNETGQPIMYTGVVGKITSGGKRLTKPVQVHKGLRSGGYNRSELGPAPSDEGTWGSSSPYIYFWTTSGQYVQWNGKYLYSDKPMRLAIKPLVIDVAN